MTRFLVPFALGLLGVLVGLLVWTAYVDHARITALWDLEMRRAAAAQQAKPAQ